MIPQLGSSRDTAPKRVGESSGGSPHRQGQGPYLHRVATVGAAPCLLGPKAACPQPCPRPDTHELLGGGLWGPDGGPRAWLLALLPPPLLRATSAGLSATTEL